MSDNIEIKDFIIEQKDYIFVYSVLVALESVLMIFNDKSEVNFPSVFQASLLCGLTLLFIIWLKFVWVSVRYLNIQKVDSLKNALLIAQNAIFSILLGYPLFALITVIYQLDPINFSLSILIVVMCVLIFGMIPILKNIQYKLRTTKEKNIIILILIAILLILCYYLIIFMKSPIVTNDLSQLQIIVNHYFIVCVVLSILIALIASFILSLIIQTEKE